MAKERDFNPFAIRGGEPPPHPDDGNVVIVGTLNSITTSENGFVLTFEKGPFI